MASTKKNEDKTSAQKPKKEFTITALGAGSQYGLSGALRGMILAKHVKSFTIKVDESLNVHQSVVAMAPAELTNLDFVPTETTEFTEYEAVVWYNAYQKIRKNLVEARKAQETEEKRVKHENRQVTPASEDWGVKFYMTYTEVLEIDSEEEKTFKDIDDEESYNSAIKALSVPDRAKFLSTGKDRKRFKNMLYRARKEAEEEEEDGVEAPENQGNDNC